MNLNQSRISEISCPVRFHQPPSDNAVVLATQLGFARFKFLVVDPKARNSVYFLLCLRISEVSSGVAG